MKELNNIFARVATYYGVSVEELDASSSLVRQYYMARMGRPRL